MSEIFDYVVIGSGFGGSVSTCRLAEKSYSVCLLERGQDWPMYSFPRRINEIRNNAFWDPEDKKFGFMEILDTPASDAMTLTASGLGGGSLIYANVLKHMPSDYFVGWPSNLQRSDLDPFYDKVIQTMEASPYPYLSDPYYQDTPKTKFYIEAGKSLNRPFQAIEEPKISHPHLAIRFSGDFPGQQTKNSHGAIQSKCNKCGECDIGCNIHAKNTLNLNYIHRARTIEQLTGKGKNAEVRTHAEAHRLEKIDNIWHVHYHNPQSPSKTTILKAHNVIVSAGSVGSTKLLLQMKADGVLPQLNNWLGKKWCGNGDLLGFTWGSKNSVQSDKGPTITTAIDFKYEPYPDGFPHGFTMEDAGFPIGLSWYMSGKVPQSSGLVGSIKLIGRFFKDLLSKLLPFLGSKERNIGDDLSDALDKGSYTEKLFVLLAMGRDRSTGEIKLNQNKKVDIKYNYSDSELHYDRVREQMNAISDKLGGHFIDNPLTHIHKMVAVHPLGGCPIGSNSENGFVNTEGKVFNYEGLYVLDGSIIPTSIGPNPSLTIAAIAERSMSLIPEKTN